MLKEYQGIIKTMIETVKRLTRIKQGGKAFVTKVSPVYIYNDR